MWCGPEIAVAGEMRSGLQQGFIILMLNGSHASASFENQYHREHQSEDVKVEPSEKQLRV